MIIVSRLNALSAGEFDDDKHMKSSISFKIFECYFFLYPHNQYVVIYDLVVNFKNFYSLEQIQPPVRAH